MSWRVPRYQYHHQDKTKEFMKPSVTHSVKHSLTHSVKHTGNSWWLSFVSEVPTAPARPLATGQSTGCFILANSLKCIFPNRNIETGHRVYDTLLCTCRVITPGKVIETPCTYVPTCLAKALGSLPTHSVCHLQHRGTSFLTSHHQYFKTS